MSKNIKNQCTALTKADKRCSRKNPKYEVTYNGIKYNLCGTHNNSFDLSKDNGNFKFYFESENYPRQNKVTEEGSECSIHNNNTQPLDAEGIKKIIIDNNSIYSDSDNEDNNEIKQNPNDESEYICPNFYEDGQEAKYHKIKTTINDEILYINDLTEKIYNKDSDNDIEIGELTRVSDKKAPIVYKGHYYIASREEEIKYKRKMYRCCALTDKCYQLGDYGIYDFFGKGYRNNRGLFTIKPHITE